MPLIAFAITVLLELAIPLLGGGSVVENHFTIPDHVVLVAAGVCVALDVLMFDEEGHSQAVQAFTEVYAAQVKWEKRLQLRQGKTIPLVAARDVPVPKSRSCNPAACVAPLCLPEFRQHAFTACIICQIYSVSSPGKRIPPII